MKLLDALIYLRSNILDDTGGQGVQWVSHTEDDYDSYQLRWSNEELVSNINEAISQVYRRCYPVKDSLDLTLLPGVSSYTLPKYILRVSACKLQSGDFLSEYDIEDIWSIKNYKDATGVPRGYTTDSVNNIIEVFPKPEKGDILNLLIYRLPITKLTFSDLNAEIELQEEYVISMLMYAGHLCYMKDEANTLDPNRSANLLSLFDRAFPYTSIYSTIRKNRTSNRAVRYRL